ncbi:MAG: hypothetical protein DI534_07960 [Leifsonia xyli]|nr:MAG: hypothetical protein DI534_07960 [Leifsonia xyli]
MATTFDRAATPASVSAALPTVRFRRIAGAIALPLAFVLQLVCNAIYAWISTESGLSDTAGGATTIEFYGRYPAAFLAMTAFALVGVLVMLPGLLAGLRVIRPTRPRLGLWAVALMLAGYVSYFGIVMTNFSTLGLARYAQGNPGVDAGAILDASQTSPVQLAFFLLFVVGNLIGTLLLGLAVILSRTLPWYAGVLIACWTVGHIINIAGGGEWFAVAGGALEIVGLGILAGRALRTSDAEWAARG